MSSTALAQSYPIESLSREEARKHALARAKLLAQTSSFELPTTSFEGEDLLKTVLQNISGSVGVFAAKTEWFEGSELERWLRQYNPLLQCAYPRLEGPSKMVFGLCSRQDLKAHPHYKNIWEAPEKATSTVPQMVFAPCTLADKKGHRMGRGLGSYDQYFNDHPQVQRVGVLHNDFLLQSFPDSWVQSHDQDLHALLTSNEFFNTTKEITT